MPSQPSGGSAATGVEAVESPGGVPITQRVLNAAKTTVGDPVRLLSLAEQGILSATNFLLLVLVARFFTRDTFGFFSATYVAYLLLLSIHRAIVVVPFVIDTANHEALRRDGRLWGVLNVVVIAAMMVLALTVAGILTQAGTAEWTAGAIAVTALLLPTGALYEFTRRWAIQLGDYRSVVMAAMIYALLLGVGACVGIALESIWACLAAIGAGTAAAALLCAWRNGRRFKTAAPPLSFTAFLHEQAGYLFWSGLSTVAYNGYNQLPALVLAAMAGPAPVAIFQAAKNFVQPISVLVMAVDNFDRPRAIRKLGAAGPRAMLRQLLKTTAALLALSTPLWALLMTFPEEALRLIYGSGYADAVPALYLWIGFSIVSVAVYPVEAALFLFKQPDLITKGRFWAGALSLAAAAVTIPYWGATGALVGILCGWIMSGLWSLMKIQPFLKQG